MQISLNQQEIDERNQLIVDLFCCANGEELHLQDIAYFLQLDPAETNGWMQQHGFGKWITGKNRHCWRGIGKKNSLDNIDETEKSLDEIDCLE